MLKSKVDLTILKRMVSELEDSLQKSEAITGSSKEDKLNWIVEMNKATGLAAGILTEAGLLMGDIQQSIAGSPSDVAKQDLVKLLGTLKGPGNAN